MNPNYHKQKMILSTIFLLCLFNLSLPTPTNASPSANVTALFAFGDSTVDSGNNNYIPTLLKSNHPPYGQNFPGKIPTGRFSNGKLSTDFLAASLGVKELLPAYLDPGVSDVDLLTGVSFASAGTGLDDRTASTAMVLNMDTQLEYFEEAMTRMKNVAGDEETKRVVNNALFVISVGTNDLLFNFYDNLHRAGNSVSGYHRDMLRKLESFIQRLYNAGARRFWVAGLPPIGCLPFQVTLESLKLTPHMFQRVCLDQENIDSESYNTKLRNLIFRLQGKLRGSKIVYVDIYASIKDMIDNPDKYGFDHTLSGCCGTGLAEMGPLCEFVNPACVDTSKYLFWDAVHLTQEAYSLLVQLNIENLLAHIT